MSLHLTGIEIKFESSDVLEYVLLDECFFFLLTSRCYYVSEMFRMPFMLHVWLLGCFFIYEFGIVMEMHYFLVWMIQFNQHVTDYCGVLDCFVYLFVL